MENPNTTIETGISKQTAVEPAPDAGRPARSATPFSTISAPRPIIPKLSMRGKKPGPIRFSVPTG